MRRLLAASVALSALSGCGGYSPEDARCVDPGNLEAVGKRIMSRSEHDAFPVRVAAARAPGVPSRYFVVVEWGYVDMLNVGWPGVWASLSLSGQSDFVAVDENAKRATDWPDAGKTIARIAPDDPFVIAARACLRHAKVRVWD